MQQIGDYLVKPAIVGGIAATGAAYMYPGVQLATPVGNMGLSTATFGAVAAGSIFSDLVHNYVIPHIPAVNGKLSDPVASAVAVGSCAAGVAGALYLANPYSVQEIGLVNILGISAVSEIGGDWLYQHYAKPLFLQA